jgi:hypothetical protein
MITSKLSSGVYKARRFRWTYRVLGKEYYVSVVLAKLLVMKNRPNSVDGG